MKRGSINKEYRRDGWGGTQRSVKAAKNRKFVTTTPTAAEKGQASHTTSPVHSVIHGPVAALQVSQGNQRQYDFCFSQSALMPITLLVCTANRNPVAVYFLLAANKLLWDRYWKAKMKARRKKSRESENNKRDICTITQGEKKDIIFKRMSRSPWLDKAIFLLWRYLECFIDSVVAPWRHPCLLRHFCLSWNKSKDTQGLSLP